MLAIKMKLIMITISMLMFLIHYKYIFYGRSKNIGTLLVAFLFKRAIQKMQDISGCLIEHEVILSGRSGFYPRFGSYMYSVFLCIDCTGPTGAFRICNLLMQTINVYNG